MNELTKLENELKEEIESIKPYTPDVFSGKVLTNYTLVHKKKIKEAELSGIQKAKKIFIDMLDDWFQERQWDSGEYPINRLISQRELNEFKQSLSSEEKTHE